MDRYSPALGYVNEACDLVMKFHYSRRIPANIQLVATLHEPGGLFGDCGQAKAACIFCVPAAKRREEVWELARLVACPDFEGSLSSLIAFAARHAKKRIDLLVSFADVRQGHHGGIYQASSWKYAEKRKPSTEGIMVNGKFIPDRTCNHLWGTRSPEKLRKRLNVEVSRQFDEGKHLYWRALSRSGKKKAGRLGLGDLPYPKDSRASDESRLPSCSRSAIAEERPGSVSALDRAMNHCDAGDRNG